MLSRQFKQRLLISSLGIVALVISIYYSFASFFKPVFVLLNATIISLALVEYYHLARNKGFQPSTIFGVSFSVLYVISLALSLHDPSLREIPTLILVLSFVVLFLLFFRQSTMALGNLAITAFGIIYLTLPLSYALRLNYFFPPHALEDGRLWLAYVLLTTKMTDVGAYFCGKIFGAKKLAPSISPKKTLEGAIGGFGVALITSIVFVLIVSHLFPFKMTFFQSIWIGILISFLAQLGDLAESLLKRDAGVKDSSHLPGLGGMLDIVDSLVFTLPLIYLFLEMHIVG